MTKPQLAVGLTQIAKARRVIDAKLSAMRRMNELLADVPEIIRPAGIEPGHGAHLYVIRLKPNTILCDRDSFQAHLKSKYQVGTAVHYPAVWTWEVFASIDYDRSACPLAERAAGHVLSLPVFAQSSDEDLQYVAWALKQTIRDKRG
jgi:dTDP-4-amino-4,6-dideoxygalactose transaminase